MILWTVQAAAQFQQAGDYISISNSPYVASKIIGEIIRRIEQLEFFPMSGRRGRVPGTRELVIGKTSFIAAYKVDGARIVILALCHGAQKWPDSL
jgi:addiction module RelE/StbE family toxin